jgi:hypothetical protein
MMCVLLAVSILLRFLRQYRKFRSIRQEENFGQPEL